MYLPTISLLQIGDVHWPEFQNSQVEMDTKDKGFSPDVAKTVSTSRATVVVRQLLNVMPKQDAVLLCGDLTTYGVFDQYTSFLERLARWTGDGRVVPHSKVHIVCGNHDIDRPTFINSTDIHEKFEPLKRALSDHKFTPLPDREPGVETVTNSGCSATIVSLNSCVGCGVKRHLNPFGLKSVDKRLERLAASKSTSMYEELDTPAFEEEQLHRAVSMLQGTSAKSLPVVLAHHNILPQDVVRVAPYTELLNAGLARGKLTSLDRPLLYLHGHIHTDPIEIMTQVGKKDARIISVSAPTLLEGFNIIKISFNTSGYPIGCLVEKWRHDSSLVLGVKTERIPLWTGGQSSRKIMTADAKKLFDYSLSPDAVHLHALSKANGTCESIARQLLELEWFGMVRLEDKDQEIEYWSVRRTLL